MDDDGEADTDLYNNDSGYKGGGACNKTFD